MHGLVAVGCRRRAVFSIAEEMVLICSVWPATSLPRSMKISLTSLTVVCPGVRGAPRGGQEQVVVAVVWAPADLDLLDRTLALDDVLLRGARHLRKRGGRTHAQRS